ncbi:hypothetical protein ACFL29_00720 [Patescibacteria group bacterium]
MEEKKPYKIRAVFADKHMGEGEEKNGEKNPLEYFIADKEHAKAIELILEKYTDPEVQLEIDELGDTFDFLSVEYKGRVQAEPTEEAAIAKIQKICKAHPIMIEAWRNVLSTGGIMKFYIGNHDLSLSWDSVKEYIQEMLTTGMQNQNKVKSRISFPSDEIESRVSFEHGHHAEYIHTPPKKPFLTSHMGKKLPAKLLNHPYGSHITADLAFVLAGGTRICKPNDLIGRMEPHAYAYLESLWRNKWFGVNAIAWWTMMPFLHRFSSRWWVRKSSNIFTLGRHNFDAMVSTILNKLRGRDFTHHAIKILKQNNDIDIVCMAHFHHAHQETLSYGSIIFPGPGCTIYKADFPEIDLTWKNFKDVEYYFKALLAAAKMFDKEYQDIHTPRKRENVTLAIFKFYKGGDKYVNLIEYDKDADCLKDLN